MLTEKQQNVLNKITYFYEKYGKSPTIEELQHLTNQKSKRGVVQYLQVLEKRGFITRGYGHRSIKLGNDVGFQLTLSIPIFGIANAGRALSYAEEIDNGFIPISKKLLTGDEKDYFCVKVEGTSMNAFQVHGKYIYDGSMALVNSRDKIANEQDAFLVILDNCATIKKIKREGNCIYLLPVSTDSDHSPIIVSENDNIKINGKVVDVFNF